MLSRGVHFWSVLNALLASVIIVLLVCLLVGQRRNRADDRNTMPYDDSQPLSIPHEVDVGRVGMRPVSFTRIVVSAEAAEGWRARGVQPQEWARLPASPGMDMAELPDGYLLTISLPGVCNADIRLSMTGQVVTVQAVMRNAQGEPVGGMERRVRLPRTPNDPADFKALFTNGVLRICVMK